MAACILACCVFYKNQDYLHMIFVVNAARTVPLIAFTIIIFSLTGWWLEDKFKKAEKRMRDIKRIAKDAKL